MPRTLLLALAVALASAASPLRGGAQDAVPQAFDRLAQQHLLDRARAHPEWATRVGIHTLDSRLDDRSAAARRRDSVRTAGERAALVALDTAALDARRRVDWLLFRSVLETAEHDAGLRDWERRPGGYVPFDAVYALAVGSEPAPDARARAITNRLRQWPTALRLGRQQVVARRTPRLWVDLDVASARGIRPWLRNDLDSLVKRMGGDMRAFRAARDDADAALARYTAWMADTLRPAATASWQAGRADYDWRLAHEKLLATDADSLIAMGHRVFAETETQLASISRTIDPHRTWRELADSAKGLHPPADSVFAAYSAAAARARRFIVQRRLFTLPPGERLEMVLTPPNLRQTYAYGGYDPAAPFEKSQVGHFFVTPVDSLATPSQRESKLRGHNYGWITVVSLHEGYPGHHLQYVRAAKQPSVLRKVYDSEVFGEGWALYSEELMYRAGYYPDSLARLTQLRMRLWRAARVIIDPSIHTGRMSFDDAVSFFVDSVGLERADAVNEVNRYTTWPTQAVSYIVGAEAMESLRADAERREGSRFDLARFHDRVLQQGSLPPVLLRRAVLGSP